MKTRKPSTLFTLAAIVVAGLGVCVSQASGADTQGSDIATKPVVGASKSMHFAPDTQGSIDAVRSTLNNFYSSPRFSGIAKPEMVDRSKLEIQQPVANYNLNVVDVLAGKGWEASKLISYIYYVGVSGKIVAKVVVAPLPDGTFRKECGVLVQFDSSKACSSVIIEGYAPIAALDGVRKGSYEVRVLKLLPSASVPVDLGGSAAMFWLKSDIPGGDLIYTSPDEEPAPGLEAGKLYKIADCLKAIRAAIQAKESIAHS